MMAPLLLIPGFVIWRVHFDIMHTLDLGKSEVLKCLQAMQKVGQTQRCQSQSTAQVLPQAMDEGSTSDSKLKVGLQVIRIDPDFLVASQPSPPNAGQNGLRLEPLPGPSRASPGYPGILGRQR